MPTRCKVNREKTSTKYAQQHETETGGNRQMVESKPNC